MRFTLDGNLRPTSVTSTVAGALTYFGIDKTNIGKHAAR
jgi:hypothetical protein